MNNREKRFLLTAILGSLVFATLGMVYAGGPQNYKASGAASVGQDRALFDDLCGPPDAVVWFLGQTKANGWGILMQGACHQADPNR